MKSKHVQTEAELTKDIKTFDLIVQDLNKKWDRDVEETAFYSPQSGVGKRIAKKLSKLKSEHWTEK